MGMTLQQRVDDISGTHTPGRAAMLKRCIEHPALRPGILQDLPGAAAHDAAASRSPAAPS